MCGLCLTCSPGTSNICNNFFEFQTPTARLFSYDFFGIFYKALRLTSPKIAVCPISKVYSVPLTAQNVGVSYLEIKALAVLQKTKFHWLKNDINLLGEKLARQHEQKKR